MRNKKWGFTLVEVAVSTAIALVLGFLLIGLIKMGGDSYKTVKKIARENIQKRRLKRGIFDELQLTSDSRMRIDRLPDGNDQVTFQIPIRVNGRKTWGVKDDFPGTPPEERYKENWSIRYTVKDGNLVRQLIDPENNVRKSQIIIRDLNRNGNSKGFKINKTGDLLDINVSTRERTGELQRMNFQVLSRNRRK